MVRVRSCACRQFLCAYMRLSVLECVFVPSLLSLICAPLVSIWRGKPSSLPGWLVLAIKGIPTPSSSLFDVAVLLIAGVKVELSVPCPAASFRCIVFKVNRCFMIMSHLLKISSLIQRMHFLAPLKRCEKGANTLFVCDIGFRVLWGIFRSLNNGN